jgi:hypothetical protein
MASEKHILSENSWRSICEHILAIWDDTLVDPTEDDFFYLALRIDHVVDCIRYRLAFPPGDIQPAQSRDCLAGRNEVVEVSGSLSRWNEKQRFKRRAISEILKREPIKPPIQPPADGMDGYPSGENA